MTHRISTGHLPELLHVSWSCTCGAHEIRGYAPTFPPGWALRIMAARAARHQARAELDPKEAP